MCAAPLIVGKIDDFLFDGKMAEPGAAVSLGTPLLSPRAGWRLLDWLARPALTATGALLTLAAKELLPKIPVLALEFLNLLLEGLYTG
ncbi:MAG: hypothetical protein ACREXX_10050 [Gammaproteobacteria bacterium]